MTERSTVAPMPPPCTDTRHEGVVEPSPREASWRSRRPQPPQRNDTERGDQKREFMWTAASRHSSTPPREHRGHTVNIETWRRNGEVEHYSKVLPRGLDNEPLSLPSQMHRESRMTPEEDPRIAHLTAMHAQLTAENERFKSENVNLIAEKREQETRMAELKISVTEKDKQIDAMKKELRHMRVILFREFELDAFGPNVPMANETNDPIDPVPPATAAVPLQNEERTGDSAYLSPRSASNSRHSPPPLHTGRCYSPLPNHAMSPRAASPQRSATDDRPLQANVVPPSHHAGQEAIPNPRGNAGLPSSPAQGVTSQAHNGIPYPPVPPAVLPYAYGHPHIWSPVLSATQVNASIPLAVPYNTLPQRPVMPSVSGMSAAPAMAPVHAVAEQMAIVGGLRQQKSSPTVRFFRSLSKSSRVNWLRFYPR